MGGLDLELLHWPATAGPTTGAGSDSRPPLLFVHGAYTAAWCWDEAFLPWFAGKGYEAYAVSLRGHGGSPGLATWARLADYVADVEATLDRLPAPPVLVAHSMGGYVAQQVVRRTPGRVAGLALMAATPPHGLYVSAVSMAVRAPLLYQTLAMAQLFGARTVDPRVIAQALFSPDMPGEQMVRYLNRFQDESLLVAWESLGLGLARWPGDIGCPVLVMGAANDQFVPRFEVEATAAAFGVEAVMIERMAHAMMLDTRWEMAARALHRWLESKVTAATGASGPAERASSSAA